MSRFVVRFSKLSEFIEELERYPDEFRGKVVRAVFRRSSTQVVPCVNLSFVASFMTDDALLLCEEFCGEDWGEGMSTTKQTLKEAHRLSDQLDALCERMQLDRRSGVFSLA